MTFLHKRAILCHSQYLLATENQQPVPERLRTVQAKSRSARTRRWWNIRGHMRRDFISYVLAQTLVSDVYNFGCLG
jgi:hypothetical protein